MLVASGLHVPIPTLAPIPELVCSLIHLLIEHVRKMFSGALDTEGHSKSGHRPSVEDKGVRRDGPMFSDAMDCVLSSCLP